ncbi:hypothetical protein BB560_003011 [Smittium megazygosporum]|uniref:Uncharacterized protein n=1 Tax=Smittium megazygosporum TaxID=133381 RepID=A0A2T9ZD50_9FUNG|nr:hypothetical protein BB560_003011 [Smittium megazygosporum]
MNSLGRIRYVEYLPGISPELVAKGLYGYDSVIIGGNIIDNYCHYSEVDDTASDVVQLYNKSLVNNCDNLRVIYPNSTEDMLRKYYGDILDVFDLTLERGNEERIIPCVQKFEEAIQSNQFSELFSCLNSYRESNNMISDESKSKIIKFLKNSEKRERYLVEVKEKNFGCENTKNSSGIKTQNSLDKRKISSSGTSEGHSGNCKNKFKVMFDFRDCENVKKFEIFNTQLDKSLENMGIRKFVSIKADGNGLPSCYKGRFDFSYRVPGHPGFKAISSTQSFLRDFNFDGVVLVWDYKGIHSSYPFILKLLLTFY